MIDNLYFIFLLKYTFYSKMYWRSWIPYCFNKYCLTVITINGLRICCTPQFSRKIAINPWIHKSIHASIWNQCCLEYAYYYYLFIFEICHNDTLQSSKKMVRTEFWGKFCFVKKWAKLTTLAQNGVFFIWFLFWKILSLVFPGNNLK